MGGSLRVLLVGGPTYVFLYTRLAEFEEREGLRVGGPLGTGAASGRRRAP